MSTFDQASLVMIPSGYKASKVYSIKPTDGSGDMSFSRSNDTATRVNSAGLIEKVRTNLILQSQAFDTADWAKSAISVTANSVANPLDAVVNADTIVGTAGTTQKYIGAANTFNGQFTFSVYAKYVSQQFVQVFLGADATPFANFDIQTGAVSASGSTASIVSVGSGWYRLSITFTSSTGSGIYLLNVDSLAAARFTATSSTGSYYAFGAQLETGDIATDYIATTSAAVSVGPVANVPRLDYLGSSCPRLLLEPQRTNLATYSEQFNNAAWTKQEVNVTANAAIAPDGTQSADNIVPTTVLGTHQIFSGALVSSSQCAMSVYAKANGYTTFHMLDRASGSNGAAFNLANGTVTNAGSGVGTITSVGNGWYRCTAVATTTGVRFYIPTPASNFTGDGTSGVLLWGAQVEAGAYATSYIPTLGAAVTRGADAASKTSASALIGQTEGTLYAEFTRLNVGNAVVLFQTNDGTSNNRAQIEISTSGAAIGVALSGGALTCLIIGPTLALGQTHKVAISYKANDFKLYVNGVLAGTDTSGAVPVSMNRIDLASELGTSYGGVSVSQILNFPTALSSAQLAELTA